MKRIMMVFFAIFFFVNPAKAEIANIIPNYDAARDKDCYLCNDGLSFVFAKITGQVTDTSGKPIAGARVTAAGHFAGYGNKKTWSTSETDSRVIDTDKKGFFRLWIETTAGGDWPIESWVAVSKPGFEISAEKIPINQKAIYQLAPIRLPHDKKVKWSNDRYQGLVAGKCAGGKVNCIMADNLLRKEYSWLTLKLERPLDPQYFSITLQLEQFSQYEGVMENAGIAGVAFTNPATNISLNFIWFWMGDSFTGFPMSAWVKRDVPIAGYIALVSPLDFAAQQREIPPENRAYEIAQGGHNLPARMRFIENITEYGKKPLTIRAVKKGNLYCIFYFDALSTCREFDEDFSSLDHATLLSSGGNRLVTLGFSTR